MPPRAGSVADHLQRAWERRYPSAAAKPAWARSLEPRHIRTWILRVVVAHDGVPAAGLPTSGTGGAGRRDGSPLPAMRAALPDEWRSVVRRRLADPRTWDAVEILAGTANALAEAVRAAIDELPVAERPALDRKRVSEWACGVVAGPYRRGPALPAPEYLAAERDAFLESARARALRLQNLPTEAEFVDRYGPVYEEVWARRGAVTLAEMHPADLGLGWLARPPMSSAENGWRAGTDQAVRLRYRYYMRTRWCTDPRAVAERAGLPFASHLAERLPTMNPDVLCRGELDRVCSPIGLRFRRHHGLCRAFVEGVETADLQTSYDRRRGGAPVRRGAALAEWAAAGVDLAAVEPRLAVAVRLHAEYWAYRGAIVEELVRGISMDWPTQIRLGSARKMWHILLHREIEWAAPLVRVEVAELVPQLFSEHLNELKATPIVEPERDAESPGPDDPRVHATLRALHRDPVATREMIARIARNDRQWLPLYDRLVAAVPQPCLPAAQFHAWAQRHLDLTDGGGD